MQAKATESSAQQAKAILRGVRISPQKARLVADQVRGMAVGRATDLLKFSDEKAKVFDPTPQFDYAFALGYAYFFTGRYEDAVAVDPYGHGQGE